MTETKGLPPLPSEVSITDTESGSTIVFSPNFPGKELQPNEDAAFQEYCLRIQSYLITEYPESIVLLHQKPAHITHYAEHIAAELAVIDALQQISKDFPSTDLKSLHASKMQFTAERLSFPHYLKSALAEELTPKHPLYDALPSSYFQTETIADNVRLEIEDEIRALSSTDKAHFQTELKKEIIKHHRRNLTDQMRKRLETLSILELIELAVLDPDHAFRVIANLDQSPDQSNNQN